MLVRDRLCGCVALELTRMFIRYGSLGLENKKISFVILILRFVRTSIKRAHKTIQLPLGEYSWNFMLEDFFKICDGNSGVIKIRR